MNIVHVAAEFSPMAKAGGMGDVVSGLTKELGHLGHVVEVILPGYSFLKNACVKCEESFTMFYKGKEEKVSIHSIPYHGVKLSLVCLENLPYFTLEKIYGYPNDPERFLAFCQAAFTYLERKKEKIDVLHLHDWHTAITTLFQKERPLAISKIVLTLHNPIYQASATISQLREIGLTTQETFFSYPLLRDDNPAYVNIIKAGIFLSHTVTTVSPTFRKELMEEYCSKNLFPLFQRVQNKFVGILNGIDTDAWDPHTDAALQKNYHKQEPIEEILQAKRANKNFCQKKLGLQQGDQILFVTIGRLAAQKGPELIAKAIDHVLSRGGQFVVLGVPESPSMQALFSSIQNKYPNHPMVRLFFHFDENLSREFYAGADFLVMPSIYEPCGLSQMIAMRYGTIPIVRKTGGLADTVFGEDVYDKKKNGYTFFDPTPSEFCRAIDAAFHDYRNNFGEIQKLIRIDMQEDFSWKKASEGYLKVYTNFDR